MKKETKAWILAFIIIEPIYAAVFYALYHYDVMSADCALSCFIAASIAEPVVNLFKKSQKG